MKILLILARIGLIFVALYNVFRIVVYLDKGVNLPIIIYLCLLEASFTFTALFTIKPNKKPLKSQWLGYLLMIIGISYPLVKKLESGTWIFMQYPSDIEYLLVPMLIIFLIINSIEKQKNA